VVNPGQTVTLTVTATGTFQQVLLVGDAALPAVAALSAPPYQFSFQIPQNLPARTYQLAVVGAVAANDVVYSDPIFIDVEPANQPISFTIEPQLLEFDVHGDQVPLRVIGQFSDGSMADLTQSSTTSYTTEDPAIAAVSPAGLVTAVSSGQTRILVNRAWAVTVIVPPPVTVLPSSAVLHPSQTQQFIATVRNASNNTGVLWSVRAGDAGTINSGGLYNAPASIPAITSAQVIATSVADSTKTATSVISLYPAISITLSPSSASLRPGQFQQFSATLTNAVNSAVTWSISPALGTITASGLYTAPPPSGSAQTVTLIATSAEDPSKSTTATISIKKN
jgi:hypothetical protein